MNQRCAKSGQPPVLLFANKLGHILSRFGLPPVDLSIETILNRARRKIKYFDWNDKAFLEPLSILLKSLEEDAHLSPVGRLIARYLCVEHAANRLRIVDILNRRPEIANLPVRHPLIIIGPPRTGSTLLHNLLSLAPDARGPMAWEVLSPPSISSDSHEKFSRISHVRRFLRAIKFLAPKLSTIHKIDTTDVEECYYFFGNAFVNPMFGLYFNVPSYFNWLWNMPVAWKRWAYGQHKHQLQILQVGCEDRRWVLKGALHLQFLDTVAEEYPGAVFVQLHREPCEMIPSICSLLMEFRKISSDNVDPMRIGRTGLNFVAKLLNKDMEARKTLGRSSRLLDIRYPDLVKDPVGTVRSIHEHFDLPFDEIYEKNMKAWLAENPQHKHGTHKYSLEEFGLYPSEINELLADYRELFL